MSKLILVRHGRTAFHVNGRYAGTTDVELDEVGRQQVEKVVERLSSIEFGDIYSSPLSRCYDMAKAVAEDHGQAVIIDDRITELNMGHWDGQTYVEIIKNEGELLRKWTEDPTSLTVPGGESLIAVQERAMEWFAKATADHPEGTIMAASHGGPIRAILSAVLGLPLAHLFRLTVDLASINIVNYKGEFSNVEELNDRGHLAGLDDSSWL